VPADRLNGRVAFITGAARGQGRSHAVTLAEEGADVVVFDVAEQLATVRYPMSGVSDIDETVRLVEQTGRRCTAFRGDVRSDGDLRHAVEGAIAAYGRIDIVIANAGIFTWAENTWSLSDEQWQVMIDVNLTGVWRTCKATIPQMIERKQGGAVVLISSISGLKGIAGTAHYCSAKHGLSGLMRTLAVELAPHAIRVNSIHPSSVATPMVENDVMSEMLTAAEQAGNDMSNLLDIELLPPRDISNAIKWIVSDDARFITGTNLLVDAGFMAK
jgi:SDR family mycofactocin-dependent oxidoreductase